MVPAVGVERTATRLIPSLVFGGEGSELIDAMMDHPILINRPIVVTPLGVKLCRPSEAVLDILPGRQLGPFNKEDGEPVIDVNGNRL